MSTRDPPVIDVALAVVHRDGRWLVARRRLDAHLGGMWEFPGGKMNAGESATQAALRELAEECRVMAEAQRTLEALRCDYGDRVVVLTPVVCKWTAGEAQPLGCDECRWVTPAELSALSMPPVNAAIIEQITRAG